jgi:UDP-N-acetylmuramyl pentapeptide phosphotransferase/UDP-N-acetylglucosamine-1-phosphate transferase
VKIEILSGRPSLALCSAAATWSVLRAKVVLPTRLVTALSRTNHRGEPISLIEGPAVAFGATLAAAAGAVAASPQGDRTRTAAAVLLAGGVAGAVGAYDDVVGARPEQRRDKGFAGHLRALRQGRISTGAAKVAGIGAAGLACAALLPRPGRPGGPITRTADVLVDAALVAGSANLLNLFDLRPGRALKVALLAATPMTVAAGPAGRIAASVCGAACGALGDDLGERTMLGDTGANALGALLGMAAAAGLPTRARVGVLAGIVALTAASERVSFTAVIARTPVLREFDALGRRPAVTTGPPVTAAPPAAVGP